MNFKTMSPLTILIIIVVALVGTVGVIYAASQLLIPGEGTVVVTPAALTVTPTSFTWPPITKGGASIQGTLVLKNNGGTDTGTLMINCPMPLGMSLTVDDPTSTLPLAAGAQRSIEFTLTATSAAAPGVFSHTVTISD